METDEVLERTDITAEVERCFDDSSIAHGEQPKLVLVTGGVAVGKSRMRRARYARGYVNLDAGDIFIRLSRGRYIAFPSFLEEPMDMIGQMVASQAVQERRHIVCELIGAEVEPMIKLIETYRALDYYIHAVGMTADLEQSLRWNQERSDDNISAYYAEPFHHRWLLSAAADAEASH
jgi:hypothetical protein